MAFTAYLLDTPSFLEPAVLASISEARLPFLWDWLMSPLGHLSIFIGSGACTTDFSHTAMQGSFSHVSRFFQHSPTRSIGSFCPSTFRPTRRVALFFSRWYLLVG